MRVIKVAALALALAGCGGSDEGEELTANPSDLTPAQINAALGPEDQSNIQDAVIEPEQNELAGNEVAADAANAATSE